MDKSLELLIPISTTRRSSFLAYLALGFGIVSVSFSAIFVRWAGASGTVTSLYRMTIAALVLAWPFHRQVRVREDTPRLGVRTALLAGLFFAGDFSGSVPAFFSCH